MSAALQRPSHAQPTASNAPPQLRDVVLFESLLLAQVKCC